MLRHFPWLCQTGAVLSLAIGSQWHFLEVQHANERKDLVNLISARSIVEELGLKGVRHRTNAGKHGLLGDSPFLHIDTTKLMALEWQPRLSIEEGIRNNTVRYLQAHSQVPEKRA